MTKKNFKKALFALISILVLFSCVTTPTYAISGVQQLDGLDNVLVVDDANLLTDTEEDALINLANSCISSPINVLFLTVNDSNVYDTMTYSDDYMDALFKNEDAICFVIDMYNREFRVNTSGRALINLSDLQIEDILDRGTPYIKAQEYYDGLGVMAQHAIPIASIKITFLSQFGDAFLGNLIYGFGGAAIFLIVALIKHNSANKQVSASTYLAKEAYTELSKDEKFIRSYNRVHKDFYKPQSSSSSGGGGGSSSHRSSSGRSHGGGGRKF